MNITESDMESVQMCSISPCQLSQQLHVDSFHCRSSCIGYQSDSVSVYFVQNPRSIAVTGGHNYLLVVYSL